MPETFLPSFVAADRPSEQVLGGGSRQAGAPSGPGLWHSDMATGGVGAWPAVRPHGSATGDWKVATLLMV